MGNNQNIKYTCHKVLKFWDAKNQTKRFYHGLICLDDANGIANSEDPDQTAPLGAV